MRCTLLLPGSLIPKALAAQLLPSLQLPFLGERLKRATLVSEQTVDAPLVGAAHLHWLWTELAGRSPIACAPYAWFELTGEQPAGQLWFADPVHMSAARDHLLLLPIDEAALSNAHADALYAAANEACAPYRCRIVRAGSSWFLQPEEPWTLTTTPLPAVAYREVAPPSLDSDAARRWLRLQNEIQMSWHADTDHAEREEAGHPVINSLWLSGGGTWQSLPPTRFAQVHARDAGVRGLARAAGARAAPLDSPVRNNDDTLLVLDAAFAAYASEAWDHWLTAMAAIDAQVAQLAGTDSTLEIVLAGATAIRTYASAPGDRWRVWRSHALASALGVEPE
jgi:hypothetical protein